MFASFDRQIRFNCKNEKPEPGRIVQDFDLKRFGRVEVKATCMSQHLCKYDDAAGKPTVSHMWGSNAAGISDTPRDALAYGGTCF